MLLPNEKWNTDYKFKMHGRSDLDNAMTTNNHRSISGGKVSITQKFIILFMTKAKNAAAVGGTRCAVYVCLL